MWTKRGIDNHMMYTFNVVLGDWGWFLVCCWGWARDIIDVRNDCYQDAFVSPLIIMMTVIIHNGY